MRLVLRWLGKAVCALLLTIMTIEFVGGSILIAWLGFRNLLQHDYYRSFISFMVALVFVMMYHDLALKERQFRRKQRNKMIT